LFCLKFSIRGTTKPKYPIKQYGKMNLGGERSGVYRVLVERPEGRNHLEDPGVGGGIILESIFKKWNVGAWTGSSWLRIGTGCGQV
jgi:hypothetical protein